MERLGQESLHLSGARDGELVLLRKLIHTQNGDDILETLVVLQDLLDGTSGVVVLVSDDHGVEHTGVRVQRVDSWVDSQLGDLAGQHSGGIQVSEGGGWGRIGQIIGRDIDGLHRGNGSLGGGGNSLLEATKISRQGWLVTDSRWDTSQKGRHLGVGLGEPEDVVDEEQHILTFLVTEVLGDGESGQTDTGAGTWGLVHLAVHEGALALLRLVSELDDAGLDHLGVQVVSFARSLSHTGKDGETSVGLGDVVDELHNQDSLSDSGSSEESDLSSSLVRGQKIDDLDTGDKHLLGGSLLDEGWGLTMDGQDVLGVDRSALVDGLSDDVHDTSQGLATDRDLDRLSRVPHLLASHESLGGIHGNGTDGVLSQMLRHLKNETDLVVLDLQGSQDRRQVAAGELNIDDGTNDLGDSSLSGSGNRLGLRREASVNILGDLAWLEWSEAGVHRSFEVGEKVLRRWRMSSSDGEGREGPEGPSGDQVRPSYSTHPLSFATICELPSLRLSDCAPLSPS
mmetsp:Transcript_2155/g.4907  ORF Transcript_2155/g.4907 Transcript_2155/m.4907 type:complete len:511 (-) Transcript_2155:15-1547(-)